MGNEILIYRNPQEQRGRGDTSLVWRATEKPEDRKVKLGVPTYKSIQSEAAALPCRTSEGMGFRGVALGKS